MQTCTTCGFEFKPVRITARYCSSRCRVTHHRGKVAHHQPPPEPPEESKSEDYTAANIQIRDGAEFDFVLIEQWAREYVRPEEWVRRGVEACRLAGVEPDYFKTRYLDKEKSIPAIPEVLEISNQLQLDAR